jgi:uncharacterized membrane protein HdeD (DUF308 family)
VSLNQLSSIKSKGELKMTAGEIKSLKQVASAIWWLVLLRGIAAVLLGILLFTNTAATLSVIIIFLGIYWVVDGISTLLASFIGREEHSNWGWGIFVGIISILAGLAVLSQPVLTAIFTTSFIVSFVGIMIIISGVWSIVTGFRLRKTSGEWVMIIGGVLGLILGLLLVMNPLFSALVYVYIIAVFLIIGGFSLIVMAFQVKKLKKTIS